ADRHKCQKIFHFSRFSGGMVKRAMFTGIARKMKNGGEILHRPGNRPSAHNHGVTEEEVLQVLRKPGPVYRGDRNSRLKAGQTDAGRYLQVVYSPDPAGDSVFVITAYPLTGKALKAYRRRQRR